MGERTLYPDDPDQVPASVARDPCADKHGGAPTSVAAWKRQLPKLRMDQAAVLAAVRDAGRNGLTCKEYMRLREVQDGRHYSMNNFSARFTELSTWKGGPLIRRNGDERRDGAAVWVAT